MSGHHKWSELRAKLSPEQRARAEAKRLELIAEMPLQRLRHARDLSQQTIAITMHTTQGEVSKIERRSDMYVSTLRSYVEALGGSLDIVATFPEGSIRVSHFAELEDEKHAGRKR